MSQRNWPSYNSDVTEDPNAEGNVLVKFELNFGAACQMLKTLADQNWRAALEDFLVFGDPMSETPPIPVTFSLVGKLTSSAMPDSPNFNVEQLSIGRL